jgi:hypothetical protein
VARRDWKGDFVPHWGALFGQPTRIAIPTELADRAVLSIAPYASQAADSLCRKGMA